MSKAWRVIFRDDRGSADSAMVLIPLLFLFLIGFQISYVAHARNMTRISVQDQASVRAISGEFQEDDQFIHIDSSGDGQNLDLLITSEQRALTNLIPFSPTEFGSGRTLDLSGIAIVENSR